MLIVDNKHCTGCKLCEKDCPTGAMKVIGGKAKINCNICNNCYQCVYVCPNSAIKQETKFKEKVTVSNKEDLAELSIILGYLEKKLGKIEESLSRVESKRR
ncbi:MAG TPA: 4Fe-4S binding protein [Candidatus Paceibacterota bacterium]|nr:4Fe-4S binding protein [Candidatus Paceibacterota bacterium]